jgi:PBP1b-binding outer membrane lipoprotein LpoB
MNPIKLSLLIISAVLMSACANQMHTQHSAPPAPKKSNAEMAEQFSNAVQRCVGMGLSVGSPTYDACVKSQLK